MLGKSLSSGKHKIFGPEQFRADSCILDSPLNLGLSNGQIPRKKDGVAGVNHIRASADNDDDTSDTFNSSVDSLIHYVNLI